MTPYGRREDWEDKPRRLARGPAGRLAGRWARRADLLVLALGRGRDRHLGPTSRPVPQWTRPGTTPVETLGRHGPHH